MRYPSLGLSFALAVSAALGCGADPHASSAPPAQATSTDRPAASAAIARALDDFHDAAARADEARYFAHFADDAVFLGIGIATEPLGPRRLPRLRPSALRRRKGVVLPRDEARDHRLRRRGLRVLRRGPRDREARTGARVGGARAPRGCVEDRAVQPRGRRSEREIRRGSRAARSPRGAGRGRAGREVTRCFSSASASARSSRAPSSSAFPALTSGVRVTRILRPPRPRRCTRWKGIVLPSFSNESSTSSTAFARTSAPTTCSSVERSSASAKTSRWS